MLLLWHSLYCSSCISLVTVFWNLLYLLDRGIFFVNPLILIIEWKKIWQFGRATNQFSPTSKGERVMNFKWHYPTQFRLHGRFTDGHILSPHSRGHIRWFYHCCPTSNSVSAFTCQPLVEIVFKNVFRGQGDKIHNRQYIFILECWKKHVCLHSSAPNMKTKLHQVLSLIKDLSIIWPRHWT